MSYTGIKIRLIVAIYSFLNPFLEYYKNNFENYEIYNEPFLNMMTSAP